MRKFIKWLFYVPKHEKISEKTILTRITTTITIVLICLVSLSVTAYAHFSCNIASSLNIIKAATFEAEASVQISDSNGEAVAVDTTNRDISSAVLQGGQTYYITLQYAQSSTAKTGFVIITAENCNSRYHTQQLGKDGNGSTETISFYVKVNSPTTISFISHWGTSSYYDLYKKGGDEEPLYITQGEIIELSINNIAENKHTENSNTASEVHKETAEATTSSAVSSTVSSYTESTVSSVIQTTSESAPQQTHKITETTSNIATESAVTADAPTTEGIE